MINNKFILDMDNLKSLETFSVYIKELIKKYSQKEIIEKSGIDKNVLYRILNQQNITLDNYYKIVNAYPQQAEIPTNKDDISDLPILGQLIENDRVKLLNLSQPRSVPVPTGLIEKWSPVFGYLVVSHTFYSGHVIIFTSKGLDDVNSINQQCVNRIIMAYPEDRDPVYGMIVKTEKCYQIQHCRERTVLLKIPFKNKIKWAKFMCIIPYSLMENVPLDAQGEFDEKLKGLELDIHKSRK